MSVKKPVIDLGYRQRTHVIAAIKGERRRSAIRDAFDADRVTPLDAFYASPTLPDEGRRFEHFGAGDRGTVVRADPEAGTCDVAFDCRAGGALQVAARHLRVVPPSCPEASAQVVAVVRHWV